MPAATFKIIQLDNGDYALARDEADENPVVVIHFSEETKAYLKSASNEVATSMIEAGIECVEQIARNDWQDAMSELEEASVLEEAEQGDLYAESDTAKGKDSQEPLTDQIPAKRTLH